MSEIYWFGLKRRTILSFLLTFLGSCPQVVQAGVCDQRLWPKPHSGRLTAINDEWKPWVKKILASTESVWTEILEAEGIEYTFPELILYNTPISINEKWTLHADSGLCYLGTQACIYLSRNYVEKLKARSNAASDLIPAFLIAHEVGHHVQVVIGFEEKMKLLFESASQSRLNSAKVLRESHADCLAGVWAHWARKKGALSITTKDRQDTARALHYLEDDDSHGLDERIYYFFDGLRHGDYKKCPQLPIN